MNDYQISRDGNQATICLGETLNATMVTPLQSALKQEIGAGAREIVFDFNETKYIDSTGIGLMIAAGNSLAAIEGKVRVVQVCPDILKLFQCMRLTTRLQVTAVGAEAVHG